MTQTQVQNQTPEQTPRQKVRKWVKVKYYVGASARLYFYIPVENDVMEERVIIQGQKWAEPVINYLKTKGKHRVVGRYGCSHVTHICGIYRNHVYVAKIAPKKLLRIITSSPTWERSEHAKRVIELLRKL